MYLPTVFQSMYIAATKNYLINNKNINAVGNKKKNAGAADFKIDPWVSEQKNLSLYSLELTVNIQYLILPGNDN